MATMDNLRARASSVCVAGPGKQAEPAQSGGEGETRGRGLGATVLDLAKSASPGLSDASAAMQMLSSTQSVTPVVGTVHDPALMNEVARQLRSLNIQVLIPELYSPNGLGGPDPAHSPYLQN